MKQTNLCTYKYTSTLHSYLYSLTQIFEYSWTKIFLSKKADLQVHAQYKSRRACVMNTYRQYNNDNNNNNMKLFNVYYYVWQN